MYHISLLLLPVFLDQSSRPAAAAVDGVVVVEIVAGGGAVAGEPA